MARRLQRSMISMITIAIYISLFSVCRGAAVDAPITQSQTEKSELLTPTTSNSISTTESSHNHQHLDDSSGSVSETSEVKVGSHPRFARSVPAPESVVNYNYLPSLSDYESDMRDMSYIRQSHKLPVNSLSSSDYMTRDKPTWQLEPQVGKASTRGKRVRGGQSYYNSRREQLPQELVDTLDAVERGAATTMLSRQQRNGRRYDVPQIECPRSPDHMERFACPRPDRRGRFRCIDDRALCDGFYDCPDKEDENPDHCLFYKTTKAHLDILAEALLRWARGR